MNAMVVRLDFILKTQLISYGQKAFAKGWLFFNFSLNFLNHCHTGYRSADEFHQEYKPKI